MKKIKICGNTKSRVIKFKTSFNEFRTFEFCNFLDREEKLSKLEDQHSSMCKEFDELEASEGQELTSVVMLLDSEILDLERRMTALKIEMLGILSDNSGKTVSFLLNTKGVTGVIVNQALEALHNAIGDFDHWVKSVKLVGQFRFTDYKRERFWNLTKVRDFEVFNTDSTTLLRDSAAGAAASKVDSIETEFSANRWGNLPRFLAYICRPSLEKEEIAVVHNNIKGAFFVSKQINSLSVDDRLTAYNNLLAKTADLRTPIFSRLPLATAIGAYKQYFFLSPP